MGIAVRGRVKNPKEMNHPGFSKILRGESFQKLMYCKTKKSTQ
jgi:hypothetical protein